MSVGVLRRAHITLFGSAAAGLLAIANEILCARYLGVNAYGLYALAVILARICELLSGLGLPVASLHYVSKFRDRGDRGALLGVVIASFVSPLVVGALVGALLWTLAPWIAASLFGNAAAQPYLRAIALGIPFMGMSEILGVVTRGYGIAGYYVIVRSLVPPLVFMAGIALIVHRHWPATWVAAAFSAAYAVGAAAATVAVVKVCGTALFREAPHLALAPLYRYSLPVLVNTLLYLVVACTSILMLGAVHSDKEVGIFRACMQLVIPFDMVVIAFNAAVGHLYPVLDGEEHRAELAALVRRITRWMTALSLLMLLAYGFNRYELMGLMGPAFVAGGDTLLMLATGHALLCSIGSAGFLLVMSGRQRYETFNAAVAAIACVALNAALLPPLGVLGAALATALACLLISVLRVAQVRRATGILVLEGSSLRLLGAAGATALLLWAVERSGVWVGLHPLLAVAGRTMCIAGVFAALYWFGVLRAGDRDELRAMLRRSPAPAPDRAA